MFLLKWYEEYCRIRWNNKSIKTEFETRAAKEVEEIKFCKSCETLNHQLELANYEKKQLLDKIFELTKKEAPAPDRTVAPPMVSMPHVMPWRVRQQMMEREDRAKAATMNRAAKPDAEIKKDTNPEKDKELEDLEKELDNAESARESQSAN